MLNFLPIPAKSHYTFNLRDFSRVIRGILLVPAPQLTTGEKLTRLWIHECYRVFYDRLNDPEDRYLIYSVVYITLFQYYVVTRVYLILYLRNSVIELNLVLLVWLISTRNNNLLNHFQKIKPQRIIHSSS